MKVLTHRPRYIETAVVPELGEGTSFVAEGNQAALTKAEAEREYHVQTDVAEGKYLYVPFYAVSDSAIQVTDDALKAYYNKNIERYKTEESRDIKYVSIPVEPSSDDTLAVLDARSTGTSQGERGASEEFV